MCSFSVPPSNLKVGVFRPYCQGFRGSLITLFSGASLCPQSIDERPLLGTKDLGITVTSGLYFGPSDEPPSLLRGKGRDNLTIVYSRNETPLLC